AVDLRGARADRREVRARVRLAHADGEGELAAHDAGQDALALRFGAEPEEQRTALAIRHPVHADRCAGREHLLHHDVTLEERALAAAVLLRPRHADPAAGADALAELAIEAAPRARALHRVGAAELLVEELAHLLAEGFGLWREIAEREVEGRHAGSEPRGPRRRNRATLRAPCVGSRSSLSHSPQSSRPRAPAP